MTETLFDSLHPTAAAAQESGILDVINYGWAKGGVIPLWAGEGDMPTPGFICDAATRGLAAGDTFYTHQRGVPPLREALATYHGALYGQSFSPERFIVTGGGMQAIQLAVQAVVGAGKTVVIPSPAWPNAAAAVELRGAKARFVPMALEGEGRAARWVLDIEALKAACDASTRAIFINSPCNPTGWIMPQEALAEVLAFAREKSLWIIADEIYARYVYDGAARAPSFLDVSTPDDRILYVNTFSKNGSMTGWRIGWVMIPEDPSGRLGQVFENLVQYNTSGVAGFMQRAGTVALTEGESYFAFQLEKARQGRERITDALLDTGRVAMAVPDGAFYAFFAIDGFEDTGMLGRRLIDDTGIGLAPGTAFGPGGERFMRLCFVRKMQDLEIAADRLRNWICQAL